mmetsp:Transcript_29110/g.82046  ORF Transcript_29110/g.82046 Transcript_29110/m.82046 type:complete len:249 (+) Transcript_29110:2301-3047(+)
MLQRWKANDNRGGASRAQLLLLQGLKLQVAPRGAQQHLEGGALKAFHRQSCCRPLVGPHRRPHRGDRQGRVPLERAVQLPIPHHVGRPLNAGVDFGGRGPWLQRLPPAAVGEEGQFGAQHLLPVPEPDLKAKQYTAGPDDAQQGVDLALHGAIKTFPQIGWEVQRGGAPNLEAQEQVRPRHKQRLAAGGGVQGNLSQLLGEVAQHVPLLRPQLGSGVGQRQGGVNPVSYHCWDWRQTPGGHSFQTPCG